MSARFIANTTDVHIVTVDQFGQDDVLIKIDGIDVAHFISDQSRVEVFATNLKNDFGLDVSVVTENG